MHHGCLANHSHRRLLATPDAGRRDHIHVGAQDCRQLLQQILRASQFAGQAITHTHGELRRFLPFAQHLEVVIERRDFEDFCHRHIHLPGECDQMPVVQAAPGIVELVQVLDQQIAPMGRRADEFQHLGHRHVIGLPALELTFLAEAAAHLFDGGDGYDLGFGFDGFCTHSGGASGQVFPPAHPGAQ